jgi:hypothetical protein
MARKNLICLLLLSFMIFAEKYPKINGVFIQPMLGYGVANENGNFKT